MGLDAPDEGFRHRYLDFEALTRQLRAWAERYPDHVRLRSIARTSEGREVWVLTVGPEPDRVRPAVWVDGNMHGAELAGSSVALAVAETVLRLHVDDDPPVSLPDHLLSVLRQVLFHFCPRMSPDGAEVVLTTGEFIRSSPRRHRHVGQVPHWQVRDLDGDGVCRYLRVRDAAGDFVASTTWPGLMLPRRLEDPPPYYKLYPEGVIEHWDGVTVPEPQGLRGTTDFNRNFPWSWQPEPEQVGAGDYPGSEPETRAVIDFAVANPNLYAWLNLHTFGGVFIRPRIDVPDKQMDQGDLAVYRQLADWGAECTGYPTVSGFEEFTYQPDTPLHGDLVEFAYHQRGCVAEVCELWDLFRRLKLPRQKRFVDYYSSLDHAAMEGLAAWDAEHNDGRLFRNWQALEHPQLGAVEVGGVDPRIGVWNPPPEVLPGICDGMASYWLRVAAMLPGLAVEALEVVPVGGTCTELRLTVANRGYLPTHGMNAARDRPWNMPVQAELVPEDCSLAEGQPARRTLGHLDGWGRGVGDWAHMPWFQRSPGSGERAHARWILVGEGRVTLRVGSDRLGWCERRVTLGKR